VIALLASVQAWATSDVSNTYIADIAINREIGHFIFIRVAQTPASPGACSTHGYWHYTLALSSAADRDIYAMLLSAHASHATVDMSGLGVCNEFGTVETLRSVRLSQ
jgi:hypothetical protein